MVTGKHHRVNYLRLKAEASGFAGNCTNTRIAPLAVANAPSTSSSDRTGRQYPNAFVADISRRVDVPIMVRAAMGARPCPDIERHLVADQTTGIAGLGTRIPSVAPQERLSGASGLVFQEADEYAPPRVTSGFREGVVRHDPFHMQVFDNDDLVIVNDPPRQPVQVIFPGACNARMGTGDQLPGFVPAL